MRDCLVEFQVDDLAAAVEFYRGVLGFELVGVTGRTGSIRARIHLGSMDVLFRSAGESSAGPHRGPIQERPILHVPVEDVDGLYERIKSKVTVVREYTPTLFGVAEFAIEDVNGLVLWFHEASGKAPDSEDLLHPPRENEG